MFFLELLKSVMLFMGFVGGGNAFPRPLSPEEERECIKKWAAGDEDAKNMLIEHNLRLVAHIAKKYAQDNNFDDLVSVGTIGLIKGVNTFDEKKAPKLTAYISRCIENEVLMSLRLAKKSASDVSLEDCIGTDKEGNNMTFSDILAAEGEDLPDAVDLKINTKRLYEAIKSELLPDEKKIICWRYGLLNEKRKTQKEIAQILGISRSYVSRIEKRAVKKLAKRMEE